MSQIVNPDPDLMRIFDFTDADLEANRSGKITERQIRLLRDAAQNPTKNDVGCMVAFMIPMALALMMCVLLQNLPQIIVIVILIIMSIIIAFLIIVTMGYVPDLKQDLGNGLVKTIEGKLVLKSQFSGKSVSYTIHFADKKLGISEHRFAQLKTINTDHAYRAYFLPKSQIILSAEVIE